MKKIINSIAFLLIFASVLGQSNNVDSTSYPFWIEMMQDESVNFLEVQATYNNYIKGKVENEVEGWKMYRRWEYLTSLKVDQYGNRPKPNHKLLEYEKYYLSGQKVGILRQSDHWKEKGPFVIPIGSGGLGRINGMGFHPNNASVIYVAASSGGVWKTTDKGLTWVNLTDTLPIWGASDVLVDYSNPNIVYMGTGDRDNSASPGLGVWKSNNAGATWFASNSGMGNLEVAMMVMNQYDSLSILAATANGIYRTTDAGNSWTKTSSSNGYYKDIVYHPGDSSIVYASKSGQFYRSADGGWSWSRITSGLPNAYRITIGVSKANVNMVYLTLCNSNSFIGMYRSTDAGMSFNMRSNSPNIMDGSQTGTGGYLGHSWYNQCTAVDPGNANIVYVGGMNTWKSSDGGVNWTISTNSSSSVHVDHHYLGFSPVDSRLYLGCDGGTYYTANGGTSWSDVSNGLSIGQVYKIGQSATSKNLLINGYQDNGTSFYNSSWRKVLGGDGMECIIDPVDTAYMFATTQNGYLRRSSDYGNSMQTIYGSITEVPGDWVTPYILQEGEPDVMFAGYKNIWRTINNKASTVSFTKISNFFTGGNIKVIESSPANNDILYFSIQNGQFLRSDNINNGSPTYTFLTINLPTSTWPRDIEAHPRDEDIVYITQSNNIYKSTDKGLNWTDISGTLPNVNINCMVFDTSSEEGLYVGTDLGVYFKGAWMNDWIPFNGGLPFSCDVTELEIYYDEDGNESRIKAGTYGRGMWSSALYSKLIADFDSDEFQACPGQTLHFTDQSEGFYSNIEWKFPGGSPSGSNSLSPVVTYNSPGNFNVKLKIWNDMEDDSIEKTGYVKIDTAITLSIDPQTSNINSGGSAPLKASGAITYSWTPSSSLDNAVNALVNASPSTTTTYTVSGINAFCEPSTGDATAIVIVHVGIESMEFLEGQLRVYPNPANNNLNIEINDVRQSDLKLRIIDVSGKSVYTEEMQVSESSYQKEISTSQFENGLYILFLRSGSDQVSIKFIVQH